MSDSTIEWTHPPGYRGWTLNPVVGCRPIGTGCLNCYAATMAGTRLAAMPQHAAKYADLTVRGERAVKGRTKPIATHRFNGTVRLDRGAALAPLNMRTPTCFFMPSMGDPFYGNEADRRAWLAEGRDAAEFDALVAELTKMLALVFAVAADRPQHRFLLLTKRPDRAAAVLRDPEFRRRVGSWIKCNFGEKFGGTVLDDIDYRGPWPIPNVGIGCSVSTQKDADELIHHLLACPAAMRFVSYEPAVEGVDFAQWTKQSSIVHLSLDVAGALKNESFDGFTDDKGLPLSRDAARRGLIELLQDGVAMMPMGKCDAHDPKKGCPGHRKPRIDWLIVGGESHPAKGVARPFDLAWARSAIAQCALAGVACFVKQLGSAPEDTIRDCTDEYETVDIELKDRKGGDWSEWPEGLRVRQFPDGFFGGAEGTQARSHEGTEEAAC